MLVVLNPGTIPDEGYAAIADGLVVFEDTYANYLTWTPPSWSEAHAAKITHLVHTTPDARAMRNAIELSKERFATAVYVTDDTLTNPWDTLPSWFAPELDLLPGGGVGSPDVHGIAIEMSVTGIDSITTLGTVTLLSRFPLVVFHNVF